MSAYGTALRQQDWDDESLTGGVPTRRVCAWVIDLLIIFAIMGVLWLLLMAVGLLTFGLGFSLFAVLPLVPALYHFLFLAGPLSATPGQVLLGLLVRREADLGRPGVLQAVVSTCGLYLTLATGVIWLGFALFTRRRRTLHDLVSGLVVVRRRSLTPGAVGWNMPVGPRDS